MTACAAPIRWPKSPPRFERGKRDDRAAEALVREVGDDGTTKWDFKGRNAFYTDMEMKSK